MKISSATYELSVRSEWQKFFSTPKIKGALLKIEWPHRSVGYSDLCPNPDIFEGTLEENLEHLKKGRMSSLLEQAIWLANNDARHREKNLSSFEGQKRIKNAFPIYGPNDPNIHELNLIKSSGFSTIHLQVGRNPQAEYDIFHRITQQYSMMVRLDFKNSISSHAFELLLSKMDPREKAYIECAIDPGPYNLNTWQQFAISCPIAIRNHFDKVDWNNPVPFRIMMVDPYRVDVEKAIEQAKNHAQKVIVHIQNYHAVAVSQGLHMASLIKSELNHLMLDADCYKMRPIGIDNFYQNLKFRGPFLDLTLGKGIGFDVLLARLNWQRLI